MADNKIKQYKAIGYWHSEEEPYMPDPAWFIDEAWEDTEKQTVIDYLKKGTALAYYRGFSWCRFKCSGGFGTADMTDGTYVYPEGLVHYLEKHHIRLPDAFINHVKGIPEKPLSFMARTLSYFTKSKNENIISDSFGEIDFDWWLSQKGCNPNHLSYRDMTKTIKKSFHSLEEGIRFWEMEKDNPDLIHSEMNMPSWLQYTGEFWATLEVKKDAEFSNESIKWAIEVVTNHLNKVALGEDYSSLYLMGGTDPNRTIFTFIISCSQPFHDRIQNKEQLEWGEFSKQDWTEFKEFDLELSYNNH